MRSLMVWFWMLGGGVAFGQPSVTALVYATGQAPDEAAVQQRLSHMWQELDRLHLRSRSPEQFISRAFSHVHRHYLHRFEAYTTFAGLVLRGRYDCLTATALFHQILDRYGLPHTIMESTYHIFILVHLEKGDLLLETTDRQGGLLTQPWQIRDRMTQYAGDGPVASHDQLTYAFQPNGLRAVPPAHLPALLMFNQAVLAFNQQHWEQAVRYLRASSEHYLTSRNRELSELLVVSIQNAGHEIPDKNALLLQLLPLLRSSYTISAR